MKITAQKMMEDIAYATIDVALETPIARNAFSMEIDHITETEGEIYIEGADGSSVEILLESDIEYENGMYAIKRDNCYFCITLDK